VPAFHSFESKLQKNRRFTERLADDINRTAGSFGFFLLNAAAFIFWIIMNTGQIPGLPVIDPYPFTFLTMLVSLEAIFLAIFVLMSQNRQAAIDSLREEIHLQVNQIAEREITKTLSLIHEIHQKVVSPKSSDPQLEHMLKTLDTTQIEQQLEKELGPSPLVISDLFNRLEKRIFPWQTSSK